MFQRFPTAPKTVISIIHGQGDIPVHFSGLKNKKKVNDFAQKNFIPLGI